MTGNFKPWTTDNGEQVFPWKEVARLVLSSRLLDELEETQLTPQGLVKYQFSAKGHELAQVLLALSLTHPHDAAAVYYRSRPFVLASGLSLEEALRASLARRGSMSEGRDVGVMFNLPSRGGATVLPTAGDVGSQYAPAAGWAQAIRYYAQVLRRREWEQAIAVACGGEGSVAANGFWAALVMATTLRLPLLFFIEDNGRAISVPRELQTPGGNVAANLRSFANLKVLEGPGYVPETTAGLVAEAVAWVRGGSGPCLLRLEVPRLTGHTFIDTQAYRDQEELERERSKDPVKFLRQLLGEEDWESVEQEVRVALQAALQAAQVTPAPDPASATAHLFAPAPPGWGAVKAPPVSVPSPGGARINLVEGVRRVLHSELKNDPGLLVFGEDVGAKGGVHGATVDLQRTFGEERVFDTSLSEVGILGRAEGMALAGLRPVAEIQFRKYADPAYDVLVDIGLVRWRTASRFVAPVVVRMPLGFGRKTGDPWHSFSAEAIYLHTLGWRVAFPSNAADAVGLLRAALRGEDPVLFFEHRALLDAPEARRPYPGDDYFLPFGVAAKLLSGNRVTVVSWGAMLYRCLAAAEAFPQQVELWDLRTLSPWDRGAVLGSVKKTGRLLVVHEDTITGGFAGEIIAAVLEEVFPFLDAPPMRVASEDCPVPYDAGLMDQVVPTVERIREALARLLAY
ncbi:MAG: thiamine pyrophosphate-dependent enzyme [Thermoanaerobaculum sp.]|nr:thiamine pyrophosphate-dependent enzyme [Thermoanaerobaculum sp.]MDW7967764.1 transketolase C-terminal domain-containing protein [Thermoanaerobaculum sp.]